MAFTTVDLQAVETAIKELIARGAAEVSINGRSVRYTSLKDLLDLKKVIEADINSELYGGSMPIKFVEVT